MENMHPRVVEHILNIIEEWPPIPKSCKSQSTSSLPGSITS